jgi:hypothetical protein
MLYDEIFQHIGQMGKFQWISVGALFSITAFSLDVANTIFIGGEMDHWCSIQALSHLPPELQRYIGIPAEAQDDVSDDAVIFSSCEMFDMNWTRYSDEELLGWNRTEWLKENDNGTPAVKRCSEWNYDRSTFTSTIVSRVYKLRTV